MCFKYNNTIGKTVANTKQSLTAVASSPVVVVAVVVVVVPAPVVFAFL
jgi:hypothetical protein